MDSSADFELPTIKRQTDSLSAGALDLDRLFGAEPEIAEGPAAEPPAAVAATPLARAPAPPVAEHPLAAMALEAKGEAVGSEGDQAAAADSSALPFDDASLISAPRPARPPLAVRRATPEFPRGRSRTTRPPRVAAPLTLGLGGAAEPAAAGAAAEPVATDLEPPAIGVRLAAVAIDGALLGAICAGVLLLTLRIAGLATTVEDIRVLPPVPFLGFLALLSLGYLAAFTVAGGQTIGKMVMHIKVIGDDGRSVDAAGGALRAMGSLLVPLTAGLAYVPVFFTSDRRALHDRLAGTRVVCE